MGIEISGNSGRLPHEALEAGKSQATQQQNAPASAKSGAKSPTGGSDQLQLSNKATQMQALEAQISNLPVVDTQRVQDIQRTLATESYPINPAIVADKLLTFEAGLAKAP